MENDERQAIQITTEKIEKLTEEERFTAVPYIFIMLRYVYFIVDVSV